MPECRFKVSVRAGDAGRQQQRRGVAGAFGETGLDVAAGGTNITLREQHGREQVI